jgi:cyclopropane fatty-acyl-phospholipid synthase-like methyltransferase
MEKGERENVYKVYDKIAKWFSGNRYALLNEDTYLEDMLGRLPPDATILDLGCGTGKPILQYLVEKKLQVTGVDASSQMLGIAKANFPSAEFILQDMRLLHLNRKFDAIIAWHSFFHLQASDQPAMFQRFKEHLNPNGILLFTSGTEHGEAWGMNGGENLFHDSLDSHEYESLLQKHYFLVIKHTINDPDCGGATVWMAKYLSNK